MLKSVENWRIAFRVAAFRGQFIQSIIALPVAAILMRIYLDHVEVRTGFMIPDPLLTIFPAIELNWVIFAVLYSGMLLGLVSLVASPYAFLLTMRAWTLLMLFRIAGLFLLPLEPGLGSVPLVDPIVRIPALQMSGTHALFFCWEAATMALLAFTARWRDMKIIFGSACGLLSLLLLLQRAQYGVDIIAAPCFAFASLGLARFLTARDIAEARGGKSDSR